MKKIIFHTDNLSRMPIPIKGIYVDIYSPEEKQILKENLKNITQELVNDPNFMIPFTKEYLARISKQKAKRQARKRNRK